MIRPAAPMQFGDKLRGTRKELRADARVVSESAVRRLIRSDAAQVLQNLTAGPVPSADDLAADDAVLVDDVALRQAEGVIERAGVLGRVVDGEHADLVFGEEVAVGLGVLV